MSPQTASFLSQWQDRDPERLSAPLEELTGHRAYSITQLHEDLERFVFPAGPKRRWATRPAVTTCGMNVCLPG